jgi:PAS domain S-box-containing protein
MQSVSNSNNNSCVQELEKVTRLNKEFEVIFESSFDGIILTDSEGRIFKANGSIERITGVKLYKFIGKTARELEDEGIILSQSKKVIGKNPLLIQQQICTGVEVLMTITRCFDDNGGFMFHVVNLRDLTELNRMKKEIDEKKDLSEQYYQELVQLRTQVLDTDTIVIKSGIMRQVCERILKVAKTDITVLLTGPSGVGKEVVAKMIHRASLRKKGPFIQINCGAIPETLLESELFGYDKGAFTGAHKQGKIGLMEMANNGTFLLDEIGDIPLNLQVKLLRVIQEHTIYRIGSTTPIQLNVRIIAATNKDLAQMVESGKFRDDLYYRLNVIPIQIPPLHERREDVLPLAFHFLEKYNKKHGSYKSFSLEVCKILEEYHWPGNVRELENLVERMVVISDNKLLTPDCLSRHINMCYTKANETLVSYGEESSDHYQLMPLKQARDNTEKKLIENALLLYGSTRKAAEVLEVDHSTVVRKIKQLGIVIQKKQ